MEAYQIVTIVIVILFIAFWLVVAAGVIYLFSLLVKALKRYISSKDIREEKTQISKSLAEVLRENRIRNKMTQEFVAETLGVSRQAVSKWENGTSDPSTTNLITLARLYGVSAQDLLMGITEEDKGEN